MTDEFKDFNSANDPDAAANGQEPDDTDKPDEGEKVEPEKKSKSDDDAKSWQSKADKAEARANKAEAELDRLKRAAVEGSKKDADAPSSGSEDAWVAASKENFRDDLFNSDKRLEALGFSPDLIQGSTPAEMRQSFVSLQGTVDRMETGIRNSVLVEHGLQPVPGAGERATGVSYRTMPQEDFLKEVDKALQG